MMMKGELKDLTNVSRDNIHVKNNVTIFFMTVD